MPGGRPKKNQDLFEGRRDEMYDLYITQNKALDEVRDHYTQMGYNASTRAYQNRFREWGFPSKHMKMPNDQNLNERVKELWARNLTHPQMLEALLSEGYVVNNRQLARLRGKEGLKMRIPGPNELADRQRKNIQDGEIVDGGAVQQPIPTAPADTPMQIPLEIQIARQQRKAQLWQESAERMKNRSRRRRTKGWAGLPPDPGLPPRFPSELTLEESRGLLNLDKQMYKEIRNIFKVICQQQNVIRKAGCPPGVWSAVKEEFINRSPHLQSIFRTPAAANFDPNREPMALDLICMDVTKSMRVAGNTITLIDAKNMLGLTPNEARDIRTLFDNILRANYFTSKLEISKDIWDGYKENWIQQSPRLHREFSQLEDSDMWHQKHRALEVIARDVQKRRRDDGTKRDTNASNKRKKAEREGREGPTPKKQKVVKEKRPKATAKSKQVEPPTRPPDWRSPSGRLPWMPATPPPAELSHQAPNAPMYPTDAQQTSTAQIDPDLLLAAALPTQPPTNLPPSASEQPFYPTAQAPPPPSMGNGIPTQTPLPIYIRPSPSTLSRYPNLGKVWFETLLPPYTLQRLEYILDKKFGKIRIAKVEGLADGATAEGAEEAGSRWAIDQDDELEAYIAYVRGVGGKVAFVVDVA